MRHANLASKSSHKREAFRAPCLEQLEGRTLLSVTLQAKTGPPGEIDLSWKSSTSPLVYQIESSYNGIDFFTIAKASPSTSVYSDTGLNFDVQYWYRVVAVYKSGVAQNSNVTSAYTQSALPNPYPIGKDSFNAKQISPAWSFVGGKWTQSDGLLQQVDTAKLRDVKKAVLTDQTYPSDQTITAKVWVTAWLAGDTARAGVGIYTDPKTGLGYELVFHGKNQVQFLDDGVTWGNGYSFSWNAKTWYWFKLTDQNGTLLGKVWRDGTSEPSSWMFQQKGWSDRTGGDPALDGGANHSSRVMPMPHSTRSP